MPFFCRIASNELIAVGGKDVAQGPTYSVQRLCGITTTDPCPQPPNYPLSVVFSSGSRVNGNPVVCGGYVDQTRETNECFTLADSSTGWEALATMSEERQEHAFAQMNEDTFMVLGK